MPWVYFLTDNDKKVDIAFSVWYNLENYVIENGDNYEKTKF